MKVLLFFCYSNMSSSHHNSTTLVAYLGSEGTAMWSFSQVISGGGSPSIRHSKRAVPFSSTAWDSGCWKNWDKAGGGGQSGMVGGRWERERIVPYNFLDRDRSLMILSTSKLNIWTKHGSRTRVLEEKSCSQNSLPAQEHFWSNVATLLQIAGNYFLAFLKHITTSVPPHHIIPKRFLGNKNGQCYPPRGALSLQIKPPPQTHTHAIFAKLLCLSPAEPTNLGLLKKHNGISRLCKVLYAFLDKLLNLKDNK